MPNDTQPIHGTIPAIEPGENTILVFGGTGQQGGAVAASLRQKGWVVRALVRNPHGEKAQALAAQGVELAAGDLADNGAIRSAMDGAYGVFSVQPSSGQGAAFGVTDEEEVRYGKAIADIAVETGIRHFVYTSINAATYGKSGMGHFDSKVEIEDHVKSLDLPSTIVRPAGFMELLMLPGMGLDKGHYTSFLRADQKGQVIAARDIGRIVAGVFAAPERYIGRAFEIAGDTLTGDSLQESLSRAAGRPFAYSRFPEDLLAGNDFLRRLTDLFDQGPLAGHADIDSLAQDFGPLTGFDEWLAGPGRPAFEAALDARDQPIALR